MDSMPEADASGKTSSELTDSRVVSFLLKKPVFFLVLAFSGCVLMNVFSRFITARSGWLFLVAFVLVGFSYNLFSLLPFFRLKTRFAGLRLLLIALISVLLSTCLVWVLLVNFLPAGFSLELAMACAIFTVVFGPYLVRLLLKVKKL